jgi:hypothetical protein
VVWEQMRPKVLNFWRHYNAPHAHESSKSPFPVHKGSVTAALFRPYYMQNFANFKGSELDFLCKFWFMRKN